MLIVDKGSIYCKFVYFISGSITRKMYYTNLIDASSHSQQHLIYNTNINIKRGGARKPNKSL